MTINNPPMSHIPNDLGDAIDFASTRRVLVVKLRHHGDVLRRLGLKADDNERGLLLVPGETAEARIDDLLHEHGIDDFIHFYPTSRWLFKCWQEKKVADVIAQLVANGKKIVITAAPDEREISSASHPCRPCNLDGCGDGKISECLTTLDNVPVVDAIRELSAVTCSHSDNKPESE